MINEVYFHSCPLAVSSHRGIQLCQGQVDRRCLWKDPRNGGHDSASHMLQQLRGLLHLLFHEFIKGRIVQGVGHLITLHRPLQRIAHPQVDIEVTSYPTLLRHHPVESVEADMPQKDVSLSFHSSISNSSCTPGIYFFSARSTPVFQVLMLSSFSDSEATSLITCSNGIR